MTNAILLFDHTLASCERLEQVDDIDASNESTLLFLQPDATNAYIRLRSLLGNERYETCDDSVACLAAYQSD